MKERTNQLHDHSYIWLRGALLLLLLLLSCRALDCGYLMFPDRLTVSCCRKVCAHFDSTLLTYLSFITCSTEQGDHFLGALFTLSSVSSGTVILTINPVENCIDRRKITSSNFHDEFERALNAGFVLEKTVLESSQTKSYQPHFSSSVGIRNGEIALLTLLLPVSVIMTFTA